MMCCTDGDALTDLSGPLVAALPEGLGQWGKDVCGILHFVYEACQSRKRYPGEGPE